MYAKKSVSRVEINKPIFMITAAVLITELRLPKLGRVSKGINSVAILPRKEKIEKANIITDYTL